MYEHSTQQQNIQFFHEPRELHQDKPYVRLSCESKQLFKDFWHLL
jgi:hypothetical protein